MNARSGSKQSLVQQESLVFLRASDDGAGGSIFYDPAMDARSIAAFWLFLAFFGGILFVGFLFAGRVGFFSPIMLAA